MALPPEIVAKVLSYMNANTKITYHVYNVIKGEESTTFRISVLEHSSIWTTEFTIRVEAKKDDSDSVVRVREYGGLGRCIFSIKDARPDANWRMTYSERQAFSHNTNPIGFIYKYIEPRKLPVVEDIAKITLFLLRDDNLSEETLYEQIKKELPEVNLGDPEDQQTVFYG